MATLRRKLALATAEDSACSSARNAVLSEDGQQTQPPSRRTEGGGAAAVRAALGEQPFMSALLPTSAPLRPPPSITSDPVVPAGNGLSAEQLEHLRQCVMTFLEAEERQEQVCPVPVEIFTQYIHSTPRTVISA